MPGCCFSASTTEKLSAKRELCNSEPQNAITSLKSDIGAATPESTLPPAEQSGGCDGQMAFFLSRKEMQVTPAAQAVDDTNKETKMPAAPSTGAALRIAFSQGEGSTSFGSKVEGSAVQILKAVADNSGKNAELVPFWWQQPSLDRPMLKQIEFQSAAKTIQEAEEDRDNGTQSSRTTVSNAARPPPLTAATAAGISHFPSAFSAPTRPGTHEAALWERLAALPKPPTCTFPAKTAIRRQGSMPIGFPNSNATTSRLKLLSRGSTGVVASCTGIPDCQLLALMSTERHKMLHKRMSSAHEHRPVIPSSRRGVYRSQTVSYFIPALSDRHHGTSDPLHGLPLHLSDAAATTTTCIPAPASSMAGRRAAKQLHLLQDSSTAGARGLEARKSLPTAVRPPACTDFMLAVRAAQAAQSLAAAELAGSGRDWGNRNAGRATCQKNHQSQGKRCKADGGLGTVRRCSVFSPVPPYPLSMDSALAQRWAALGRPRRSQPAPLPTNPPQDACEQQTAANQLHGLRRCSAPVLVD